MSSQQELKPPTMSKARILIVDDERNVRRSLRGVLEDEGYLVKTAAGGAQCLTELQESSFELILLDVWLPGKDGLKVLREIRQSWPRQYVIMISGHGNIETAVQATKLGAYDFIEKPLTTNKVLLVLRHALNQLHLEGENRTLKSLVERDTVMIGASIPMLALRQQIAYAAPTEGRVLIYGENGTGKELVARLLHLGSRRHNRPFVDVNCAAIPDDLIESELFGSVKGAYTGADKTRKGRFEQANGATLFLDEVGDMSLKTQAKVLRVLEEQRFHRVGSSEPLEIDVRVIAATNQNLETQIEKGEFREDLFFRLNVIPFEVPPLRQRREDIPELLSHFFSLFGQRDGVPVKSITPSAMEKLTNYRWPGNVRELRNIAERLVIMVPEDRIELSHLPTVVLESDSLRRPASKWKAARERFERHYIVERLGENRGNISKTAAAIGMERSHLYRKLKAYDIKVK